MGSREGSCVKDRDGRRTMSTYITTLRRPNHMFRSHVSHVSLSLCEKCRNKTIYSEMKWNSHFINTLYWYVVFEKFRRLFLNTTHGFPPMGVRLVFTCLGFQTLAYRWIIKWVTEQQPLIPLYTGWSFETGHHWDFVNYVTVYLHYVHSKP